VDYILSLFDRLVDFAGPYAAAALLAVVVMLIIYRLMGRV